jgi:hypothetical protein
MSEQMDMRLSDAGAHRLALFVADLMATLADDGVVGAESAEAASALWHATPRHVPGAGLDLDAATLVHGLTGVSALLVAQLVDQRRAAGCATATSAQVWREVAAALDAKSDDSEETSTGTFDPA